MYSSHPVPHISMRCP